MAKRKTFISELEECIIAGSSDPKQTNKYTTDELAEIYLNGDYDEIDDDEEDLVQIIYIDDDNFSKLDPLEIKNFINNLSTILGESPYSDAEIEKLIQQCKKPKN